MNIKKEREAFENWFRTTEMYNVLIEYIATHQPILKTVFIKSGKFYRNTMVNTAWVSWQASKQHEAQKLEGCVVVPHMQPIAVVHNSGLGLFRECMVIYGWNGKSKQYQEALNKGFYFGFEKGIQHVMEAARSQS